MSTEPPADLDPDRRARPAGERDPIDGDGLPTGDADDRTRDLEARAQRLADRLAEMAEVSERRRGQVDALQARNRALKAENAGLRTRPESRVTRRLAGGVRLGRRLASRGGEAARDGLGRVGIVPAGWHRLRATPADEAGLLDDLRAALPPAPVVSGIRVGVVIAGAGATPRGLLRARLARAHVEIVDVRVIADGAGALAEAVRGLDADAILLASDGLEPVEDGWLSRMVAALASSGADVVGACIVHGRRPGPSVGRLGEAADLTVRHLGIRFEHDGAVLRPRYAGWGEDPRQALGGELVRDAAATDTCMLVRRTALDAVGGPAATQQLDAVDVDLSLRVRATGGRVVVAADAMLLDRGAGGGPGPTVEVADRLDRAWGPFLFRQVLRDRIAGLGTWSSAPVRAAIVPPADDDGAWGTQALEKLAAALGGRGWAVRVASATTTSDDVVILPGAGGLEEGGDGRGGAVRIAVPGGVPTSPGATIPPPGADVLVPVDLTEDPVPDGSQARDLAGRIVDAIDRWAAAPHVAIVVGAETAERAATWGDWYFAGALRRAFARRGMPAVVTALGDAAGPRAATADVTVALFGGATHETRPGQVNVLWIISHPDRVTRAVCDRFDLVFAASDRFARDLARRLGRPVLPLHQATDPDRYRPDPTGPRHQLLFIGNSRGVRRPILDDLRDTPYELAVYGRNWTPELLDPARLRGDWVPNDELARYYASADIVLSDHWPDMRDEGFIANRVYDAAAAGAFVISDDLPEIAAEFDGGVVTYRDAADLRALVDHFVADPDGRAAHGALARQAVLHRHTFAARVDAILDAVAPHLRTHGVAVPGREGDA